MLAATPAAFSFFTARFRERPSRSRASSASPESPSRLIRTARRDVDLEARRLGLDPHQRAATPRAPGRRGTWSKGVSSKRPWRRGEIGQREQEAVEPEGVEVRDRQEPEIVSAAAQRQRARRLLHLRGCSRRRRVEAGDGDAAVRSRPDLRACASTEPSPLARIQSRAPGGQIVPGK